MYKLWSKGTKFSIECRLFAQYRELQHKLLKIIDKNVDSLRFYRLGENYDKSKAYW